MAPDPSPRREREKSELRDKILAATRALLAEGGVEAVTMREVAKRVEYSPAALYQHFPDKDSLIRELCLHDFASFAAIFLSLSREGGPLAHLIRAGLAYLSFARDFPEQYRVMFLTPYPHATPDDETQRTDPAQNAYFFIHTIVEQALVAGLLREDLEDSHVVAQTLWAAAHGCAALDVCRRDTEAWVDFRPFEERARATVAAAAFGLARTPELARKALEHALAG